jgi:hypothetical protein
VGRSGGVTHNVYRDGKIYVCAEMCETCIFRPGNRMKLRPGRLKGMISDAVVDEGCIPCHDRLLTNGYLGGDAVCRGFYDRYRTQPLQIAYRLGLIEFTHREEAP